MARRKNGVNKSEMIRVYLGEHPRAETKEIQEACAAQGVTVTSQTISNTKMRMKKQKKKKSKRGRPAGAAAASNGQTASMVKVLELLVAAKKFVAEAGSVANARQAIEAVKKL